MLFSAGGCVCVLLFSAGGLCLCICFCGWQHVLPLGHVTAREACDSKAYFSF